MKMYLIGFLNYKRESLVTMFTENMYKANDEYERLNNLRGPNISPFKEIFQFTLDANAGRLLEMIQIYTLLKSHLPNSGDPISIAFKKLEKPMEDLYASLIEGKK